MRIVSTISLCLACLCLSHAAVSAEDVPGAPVAPPELQRWLGPQDWQRDTDGPIFSLGPQGEFDDTHIFAPCVARIDGRYFLWYSGSTGTVAQRVFDLGLATSADGRDFVRNPRNPVYKFGDGAHSILTATLLRRPDGEMLREKGRLRMWFSSTDFAHGMGRHTLHESFSKNGVDWDPPSGPLLENAYAPTILKEGDTYRMWYSDVSADPWTVGYAESADGRHWNVRPAPVLKVDAPWELGRLFYPAVIKADGAYLMWYGSYWSEHPNTTAIGVAASLDGIHWHKSPDNPVLRPDPTRPWESHYTTSQSVLRLEDGSFRIWYASRKEPPFVNKYFAINTARWSGPGQRENPKETGLNTRSMPDPAVDQDAFVAWQTKMRQQLRDMLGIPRERVPLDPEQRGRFEVDDIVIEKWIYTSEPGSRVPAVLYRPRVANGPLPGLVLTFGHGGSKSHPSYQYMGQLFAKLGFVVLAADPIGEEERHIEGRRGTRAHDPEPVHHRAWDAGRPIMGKLVWDTMRGVDFLLSRDDVDPDRIGVAGNSLGGAKAGWMAALDPRLRFAVVSGWAFDDLLLEYGKFCTRIPNLRLRDMLTWDEFLSLAAPHCHVIIANGDADVVIDRDGDGTAWRGTQAAVDRAGAIYRAFGIPNGIQTWFEPGGGHRPYPAHPDVARRLVELMQSAPVDVESPLVGTNFGEWCDGFDIQLERLYGTPLHLRGATVVKRDVRFLTSGELAVLRLHETGRDEFTLEGWLNTIASGE